MIDINTRHLLYSFFHYGVAFSAEIIQNDLLTGKQYTKSQYKARIDEKYLEHLKEVQLPVKAQFSYPLNAGPYTIFEEDAAEKMVGQEADGFTIIAAEQTKPNEIMLTLEGDIPANLLGSFQLMSITIQEPDPK